MSFRRFAVLGALVCAALPSFAATKAAPNILYILADDLGYGDVHILNPEHGRIRTPNFDRLSTEGMTFTDAHSGSSVCTPTRYGILTGRYAWRTVLQHGVLDGTDDPPLIAGDRLTVATLLKQHGYTTAAIGKWHVGFGAERPPGYVPPARQPGVKREFGTNGLPVNSRIIDGPTTRGFDYFWGCSNARTMSGLIENDRVVEDLPPKEMLPRVCRQAVRYLDEHAAAVRAGSPFFLYLALTAPHVPILPTPEWKGKSGLGDYGDYVMQTDDVVGQVLAALEKNGLAENTLVIFTADNGCAIQAGTKDLEAQGHFASGQYRGYKSDIWDGGHRVAFFVRWPGHIQAGSRSDQLICHTDFMATCADLLGTTLPPNAGEDSVSLLPALLGRTDGPRHEAVVHHSSPGMFAIREGKWKLEFCPGSGGTSKTPSDAIARSQGMPELQLYDLGSDVAEQHNVYANNPQVVAQLTRLLQRYVDDGRSTPGPRQRNDAPVNFPPVAHPRK